MTLEQTSADTDTVYKKNGCDGWTIMQPPAGLAEETHLHPIVGLGRRLEYLCLCTVTADRVHPGICGGCMDEL